MKLKQKNLAPIMLFCFNRLNHLRLTIESLKKNTLAKESELIIFSDYGKNVKEVREYIKTIKGFKKVTIVERKENFGLAKSIIAGVTEVVNKHGKVIVLEDDMVTGKYFLTYMNDALSLYEKDKKVGCIGCYVYPLKIKLPETFFMKMNNPWGFGTWEKEWKLFEPNGKKLLKEIESKGLKKEFDINNSYPFTKMLKHQIKGKNNSWAIRWRASLFLKKKLTLYPGKHLIKNIGLDDTGINSKKSRSHEVKLSNKKVNVNKIPVIPNQKIFKAIENHYRKMFWERLINKLEKWKPKL